MGIHKINNQNQISNRVSSLIFMFIPLQNKLLRQVLNKTVEIIILYLPASVNNL